VQFGAFLAHIHLDDFLGVIQAPPALAMKMAWKSPKKAMQSDNQ